MSLASTAIIGALWSIASRLGSRIVGLVGTLIITRFLQPEVMGEVGVAVIVVLTAQFFTDFALGQYIVVKSKEDEPAVYHAFVLNFGAMVLAALVLLLLSDPIAIALETPAMTKYLPIMVLSLLLERLARIPTSIALRDLHFKLHATVTGLSEVTYVGISLSMAAMGYGGYSIVWANVAQYALRLIWFGLAIPRRDWFFPTALSWKKTKEMLRFCIPMSVGNFAHNASQSWDKLIVTSLFGNATHGVYALGRSLSAVPADNVGDAAADVMMPSFVRMEVKEARVSVVRAMHLIAVLVFPLAVGLAAVSPTLVSALFNEEWQGIALPLTILASVSIIDPLGDGMTSYLKARDKPFAVMCIQISFLAVLLGASFVLGTLFGLDGACFGVGIGMAYRALSALWVANRLDGVEITTMLFGLFRVALAAGTMWLGVLGIRELASGQISYPILALAVEIAAGALVYVPAAFVFAGPLSRDIVKFVRNYRNQSTES